MSLYRNTKQLLISLLMFIALFLLICTGSPFDLRASEAPQAIFENALNLTKQGNFIEALEAWNEVLELNEENPAALSNRGNIRLVLGDAQGAIVDQTRALQLAPTEVDPHINRGIAEESLGLWDEAIADYKWILARDAEDISALYNLGNVMGSQGNWIKAKTYFDHASSVSPEFVLARSSKALSLYQIGNLDQAELELRQIIRKYPLVSDARAALTALLWSKGSIGEAESNWVAAFGLDSRYKDPEWLLNARRWPPTPISDLMAFLDLERL